MPHRLADIASIAVQLPKVRAGLRSAPPRATAGLCAVPRKSPRPCQSTSSRAPARASMVDATRGAL
eukprot:8261937-Pyramimonas_sp.AAC.1